MKNKKLSGLKAFAKSCLRRKILRTAISISKKKQKGAFGKPKVFREKKIDRCSVKGV